MGFSCHNESLRSMIVISHRRLRVSTLSNNRGVALVAVLWIFIFLFVMAFEFSSSVREEAAAAHRFAEEAEGYYLAVAGFEKALYDLVRQLPVQGQPAASRLSDLADGSWREESLETGLYRVRLVDEAGKINLNRVDEPTLKLVFTNLGMEESRRDILVDSILDWRDEDDLHRTNGAESDYYLSLSPPYTARNGPFDAVEDLLWVRGVTPELFFGADRDVGLRDIFTVDSPIDRINLRTASAEVISALLGLPLEKSRALIEERKKLSEGTMADLIKILGIAAGDAVLRQFVFVNPTVVTIEAAGLQRESFSRRQVKGVVRILATPAGYQLVRWVDRDMVKNEP